MNYCTLSDVTTLYRSLTADEQTKATALIPVISARLRQEGLKRGKDLDDMVTYDDDLAVVAKSVTVDIIARCLMTPTTGAPMTQMSESALGFTVSGSFLSPGGGVFIKDSELKALGLKRQRATTINLMGTDDEF